MISVFISSLILIRKVGIYNQFNLLILFYFLTLYKPRLSYFIVGGLVWCLL